MHPDRLKKTALSRIDTLRDTDDAGGNSSRRNPSQAFNTLETTEGAARMGLFRPVLKSSNMIRFGGTRRPQPKRISGALEFYPDYSSHGKFPAAVA